MRGFWNGLARLIWLIIVLVAVFNILSSLIMLVRTKTADIAILRTMGASRRSMMKIFMTVGLTIGLLIVVVFDFVLKLLRAYFVDVAGARIDRDMGEEIFQQILNMRLDLRRGEREGGGGSGPLGQSRNARRMPAANATAITATTTSRMVSVAVTNQRIIEPLLHVHQHAQEAFLVVAQRRCFRL